MKAARVLSAILTVSVLLFSSCKASNQTRASIPAQLTNIPTTPGGIIEFGAVPGAATMPAAMANVLGQIHQACGERPTVGQVFRVKGTNSAGVFFTVVDHAQNNRQLAGLVLAAQTGPNQLEAAVVADSANRFGQTANPMMQQLFAVWNPGREASAADPASVPATGSGAPATAGPSVSASSASLHIITAPDNSASLSIPEGWTLDPVSGHGAMVVHGPNGESMGLDMVRPAVDPTNPWQANMARQRMSVILPGSVIYPFRGDLAREFADILQAWRRAGGAGPARIQVTSTKPLQAAPGSHSIQAEGQIDPDGKGLQQFSDLMIVDDPNPQWGTYSVQLCHTMIPIALAEKEKGTISAILNTYRPNMQVINQQNAEMLRAKQQSDQQTLAWSQQQVNRIHQIGQQATARMNATQAANDAQHAGYWAQQNGNARQSAGFSNYLLDQSVVQNNNVAGTGQVGHATLWNSTANALVQADPNKYEIVNTPNYWQGVDY